MRNSRLNLRAIRRSATATFGPGVLGPTAYSGGFSAGRITRRQWFGLMGGGFASIGFLGSISSDLKLRFKGTRAGIWLGRNLVWGVDAARFAGHPKLAGQQSGDRIVLELSDAVYPGTSVSADLNCLLEKSGSRWKINLDLAFPEVSLQQDFFEWASGEAGAEALCNPRATISWGSLGDLQLDGSARVRFYPGFTYEISGRRICELKVPNANLESDNVVFGLPHPNGPTLIRERLGKRTVFTVGRGSHEWLLQPRIETDPRWSLEAKQNGFSLISIETGIGESGKTETAMMAESSPDQPALGFQPGPGCGFNATRNPVSLDISNVRYVTSASENGDETAIFGSIASEETWVHPSGANMQLGPPGGETESSFELLARSGQPARIKAEPVLKSVDIPLGPDSCSKIEYDKPPKFACCLGSPSLFHRIGYFLHLSRPEDKLELPLEGAVLDIVRPTDLLHLKFRFKELVLKCYKHKASLRRIPGKDALVFVDFPPQHAAEQAFFKSSSDTDTGFRITDPNDPDRCAIGDERPGLPGTVKSRLSGSSTLVFRIPLSVDEIPYTLRSLMDWNGWDQVVSQAATVGGDRARGPEAKPDKSRIEGDITKIELPYRLYLSPNERAGWISTNSTPDHREGVIELWHTRLGVRRAPVSAVPLQKSDRETDRQSQTPEQKYEILEQPPEANTVRAIWTEDYPDDVAHPPCFEGGSSKPFRNSLERRDRYEIVELSSNFELSDRANINNPYPANPVKIERLALSSMGAWLRSEGIWDPPSNKQCVPLIVQDWRHEAQMGRDSYVRVLYKGYLFPFGHNASLVKETKRVFEVADGGETRAYLRQSLRIDIPILTKYYSAPSQKNKSREWPFRSVTLSMSSTPPLDSPGVHAGDEISELMKGQQLFWPRVLGKYLEFEYTKETLDGNLVVGSCPLIFLDVQIAFGECKPRGIPLCNDDCDPTHKPPIPAPDILRRVIDIYNRLAIPAAGESKPRRDVNFKGQRIAYAENSNAPDPKQMTPGRTAYETSDFVMAAEGPEIGTLVCPATTDPGKSLREIDQPPFYPRLDKSRINVPGVSEFARTGGFTMVSYYQKYVEKGFDPSDNKGEVYLQFGSAIPMTFGGSAAGSDNIGGILTPSTKLVGISRSVGPVGGGGATVSGEVSLLNPDDSLADFARGTPNPEKFLDGLNAKILGGIKLSGIIKVAEGVLNETKAPKLIRDIKYGFAEQEGAAATKLITDSNQAAQNVLDFLGALPNAAKRVCQPEFGSVISALGNYLQAPNDVGSKLIQLPAVRTSLQQFAAKLDHLVHSPGELLRAFFPEWVDAVDDLWKAIVFFRDGAFEAAVRDLVHDQLNQVLSQIDAEVRQELDAVKAQLDRKLDEIVTAVAASPEVSALLSMAADAMQLVEDVRSRVRAVQAMTELAASSLSALRTNVQALLRLPEKPVQVVRDAIRQLTDALTGHVPGDIPPLSQAIQDALQQLETEGASFEDLIRNELALIQNCKQIIARLTELLPQIPAKADAFAVRGLDMPAAVVGPRDAARQLISKATEVANTYSWIRNALATPNFDSILALITPEVTPASEYFRALKSQLEGVRDDVTTLRTRLLQADALGRLAIGLDILGRLQVFASIADKIIFIISHDLPAERLKLQTAAGRLESTLNNLKQTYINGFTSPLLIQVRNAKSLLAASSLPQPVKDLLLPILSAVETDLDNLVHKLPDETPAALRDAFNKVRQLPDKLTHQVQDLLKSVEQFVRSREFITQALEAFGLPVAVDLKYDWSPDLKPWPDPPLFINSGGAETQLATLTVGAALHKSMFSSEPPQVNVTGKLANFQLRLLPSVTCITINFDEVSFSSRNGGKPEVHVKIFKVEFGEALKFVEELQKKLNPSEGPYLDIQPVRIEAGFRFAIPKIGFGVFSMQNVRIGAAFVLPLDGTPCRFRFFFCDRYRPFLLSVGIFGGGGFLALEVDSEKTIMIEGALEFGLVGSITIGFASGSGYVTAGIYFRFASQQSEVCGYLRAGGSIDVLGLITVSVDVYMSLCYLKNAGQSVVYGWAEITIKIEFFFFSLEVTLRAEKRFVGGSNTSLQNRARVLGVGFSETQIGVESDFCTSDYLNWSDYRKAFAD